MEVEAILRIYGGKDYYDRMVGAVMTNQYFTAPAEEEAKKLKILLWDRGYIDSMMQYIVKIGLIWYLLQKCVINLLSE